MVSQASTEPTFHSSPNIKTALERLLKTDVTVRDGEITRKVSALEALLLGLLSKGIKGRAQSARTLLSIIESRFPDSEAAADKTPVTAEDNAAVARFLERHGASANPARTRRKAKSNRTSSKV